MCRLFGLHAGATPLDATFWLLDAPDSLRAQSHRNPDGAGIGVFDADGRPDVDKQPIAAWDDAQFATAARTLTATTFVAHVRHASTGARTVANTHPFEQDGRIFAHNGVVQDLAALDARLEELGAQHLVRGETDSERMFALITAEAARADLHTGIVRAVGWIAEHLPVYALNFVLGTPAELWALRYPANHQLWMLQRPAGGTGTDEALDARTRRISAHSTELADRPSVVLASEPMDADAAWQLLPAGELVRVGLDLSVTRRRPFPDRPARELTLTDLRPEVVRSQLA